ncbi:thyroid transcription factor 1-associated protein 26-like [Ptychodera flava]|uniref:thyroid transcription factor 1-associated protein 26-like n=1 Tax=Ptychodera flava TaxID=63121 RepID=UPI00396A3F15
MASEMLKKRVAGSKVQKTAFSTAEKAKKLQWRENRYKKYIGNKEEGQGYADKRKRKIMYKYKKFKQKQKRQQQKQGQLEKLTVSEMKDRKDDVEGNLHESPNERKRQQSPSQFNVKGKRKKMNPYAKEQKEFQRKREEKQKRMEELQKRREETEQALKEYHRKKRSKNKKMNKKTRKGQPIMQFRMDHLLEKIKNQTNKSS